MPIGKDRPAVTIENVPQKRLRGDLRESLGEQVSAKKLRSEPEKITKKGISYPRGIHDDL